MSKSIGQTAYETFADGGRFFAGPKQEEAGAWEKLPGNLRELWERTARAVVQAHAEVKK